MSELTLEKIEKYFEITRKGDYDGYYPEIHWLIQEVKILNGAIIGGRVVEQILKQKVQDLELTRSKAERCSCIFEDDGETVVRWCDAHAIWRDRVLGLETCCKMDQQTIDHLHGVIMEREGKNKKRIKELEVNLSLNASMLARQCDLSREAETKANKYFNATHGLNETITELEERIQKLERLLCISHDYLIQHWDMEAEPLREIDEVVREILKE